MNDSSLSGGQPRPSWRARIGHIALPAAHLLALWSFAVAQPLYDILQRNGEFFIAHRTQPLDLMLFIGVVSVGLPLLLILPWAVLAAGWPRAGRIALTALIGVLATALASQILAYRVPLPTVVHLAVAAACGAALAWAYATRAAVRTFMTMLSPSVLVFPVIFLLHPTMSGLVRPDARSAEAAAVIDGPAPPIVFLIFDQLPLTSLLDAHGQIDRDRYPGFAALADHATWYRNATTVAEFTGWAVPPIVSGMMPNPTKVPTTKSYPHNLFTWLGNRYRFEVHEPITQLCPERLCAAIRDPLPVRMAGMTLDSSVVYLNVALPAGLRTHLPPLTENWKDFIQDQRWQRRWVAESKQDRRQVPRDLIASISRDDPQPTLYFAHSLLPHEPYVYLRSGQEFTGDTRLVGLNQVGRWTTDSWPVTLAYRRHLMQVEYVDAVVGAMIERLTAEGLYDDALIVVTSDHGVSFRPGQYFKGFSAANLADIMSVPLLIKAPHQRRGRIDDSNIQSVDVMPTIASLLDVKLTWTPEGRAAGTGADQLVKTIRYGGARLQATVEAAVLAEKRSDAVARKFALFGDAPGWRAAAASRGDLIGRRVDELDVTEGPWQVLVDDADLWFSVDPAGPRVPGLLTGRVRDARGGPVDAEVVIAVGGIVTAVARTYRQEDAPRGSWAAVVNPALFAKGRSDLRVYVLPPNEERLHLAYSSRTRPGHVNLASRGAQEFWAVKQSGFYPREGEPVPHRWTTGDGALVVPLEPGAACQVPAHRHHGRRSGRHAAHGDAQRLHAVCGPRRIGAVVSHVPAARVSGLRADAAVRDDRREEPAPGWATISARAAWRSRPSTSSRTTGRSSPTPASRHAASVTLVEGQPAPHIAGVPVSIVVANIGTSTWLVGGGCSTEGHAGANRATLAAALDPRDRRTSSAWICRTRSTPPIAC